MKYRTIYADPPWNERGAGKIVRGAQRHYPLMSTRDICGLRLNGFQGCVLAPFAGDVAERDAHLYLWVTNNFLLDGLSVLKAWGFEYKTMITWAKDRIGLGQYFRGQTEHCLFGVRGNLPYRMQDGKRMQGSTLINASRSHHSKKPIEMRQMIERVSVGPYLELFARERVIGWDVWGNEVET